MKDLLERMKKALGDLAAEDAPTDGPKNMTPEQFLTYATEQVEKAAKDKPEVRKARLLHLQGQVAAVAKNFEGSVPAALPVSTFKDPDQTTPTTADGGTPGPQNQPEALGNFAQNDPGPAGSSVGSQPPGGQNPPLTAGSGAEAPEQFAKMFAGLQKALENLATPPATATPPAAAPTPPPTETTPPADVKKGMGVIWPADMNSPFGQEVDDEDAEPGWGFDSGSEPAKRAETRKAAQTQA